MQNFKQGIYNKALYQAIPSKRNLQIVVNRIIPCDAINNDRRQKLLEINQLLLDKWANCTSVYFLKPDEDWTTQNGHFNKTYNYKDNLHLSEKKNIKLALLIKTKTSG